MESIQTIQGRIASLAWRVRWLRGVAWGSRCLFYGLLGALPLLLAKSVLPSPSGIWIIAAVIAGTGVGVLYGLLQPVVLRDVARLVEERLDLKARLSTALECYDRQDGSPFALSLYRDTQKVLPAFTGQEILPLRPTRESWGLLPAAAAVVLLWFAPPLPWNRMDALQPSTEAEWPQDKTARVEPDGRGTPPMSLDPPQVRDWRWHAGRTRSSRIARETEALFKDSPLAKDRPEFSSLLLGGDERMKFLGQPQAVPDLRGEHLRSPYEIAVERMQQLTEGGMRHLTPEEARRLLSEVQRMGKQGGSPGPTDSSGSEGSGGATGEKVREALGQALEALRKQEEARLKGSELPKGSGPGIRGGQRPMGGEEAQEDEGGSQEQFGSLAGKGKSKGLRGTPTPRLDASPRDTAVGGELGEGHSQAYGTNLLGAGGRGKSRLPSLHLLTRYRQMMEEALSKELIPPDYREQVKTYFDSLQPGGEGAR